MSVILDFLKTIFTKESKDTSVVVKNYITGNNNQNNKNHHQNKTNTPKKSKSNVKPKSKSKGLSTNTHKSYNNKIELKSIRLYSTGAKGKVYTNKFYKSINRNFGIEVILQNNTSNYQTVNLGHCIYDKNGNNIIRGNVHPRIAPHQKFTQYVYVKPQDFNNLKNGEYKSQFWINDKKVQKVFFTIINK